MIAWLAFACTGPDPLPETSGASAPDYAGPVGRILEFEPFGDATADPVTLVIADGTWEIAGVDGSTRSYTTRLDGDGFAVDGNLLLPPRLAAGSTAEGVEVIAVGATETWYGTFPDTVTVAVTAGAFGGTQVFARDVGLVLATWEGWSGELAYYE